MLVFALAAIGFGTGAGADTFLGRSAGDCALFSSSSNGRKEASMTSSSKVGTRAGSAKASASASSASNRGASSSVSMSSSSNGSSSTARAVSSYTDEKGRTVTKVSENGRCTVFIKE